MTARQTAADMFLKTVGWQNAARQTVAGDASNRRYERLTGADGTTAILMDAPPDKGEDTGQFVRMAAYLRGCGLSAPEVLHADERNGFLLIEDLGDALYARLLEKEPEREMPLYRAAVDVLAALHRACGISLPLCDADWLTRMTDLFFDWYLPSDLAVSHAGFAELFLPLAKALDEDPKVVILRDYHAENLLWLPDRQAVARVGLLDFQDALLGHPAYDLVSVLQDARRDLSPEVEAAMMTHYIEVSGSHGPRFRQAYAILGLQRNLRILGIFARLSRRDGKMQYIDKIPRVWGHVMKNLDHPALSEIRRLLQPALPPPDPHFLESLKTRCATNQLP